MSYKLAEFRQNLEKVRKQKEYQNVCNEKNKHWNDGIDKIINIFNGSVSRNYVCLSSYEEVKSICREYHDVLDILISSRSHELKMVNKFKNPNKFQKRLKRYLHL
ncbi:hypothetical protein WCWAEYFT_CDS0122 [Vibrio phage VB_VaC_TDDLMA]